MKRKPRRQAPPRRQADEVSAAVAARDRQWQTYMQAAQADRDRQWQAAAEEACRETARRQDAAWRDALPERDAAIAQQVSDAVSAAWRQPGIDPVMVEPSRPGAPLAGVVVNRRRGTTDAEVLTDE